MKRRLNKRFLFTFLGVLTGLALVVHLVHGLQVQAHVGELLTEADQAIQHGKLDEGLLYYSHYLSFQPQDLAAQERHALALDKKAASEAEMTRAAAALEKIVRQDPDKTDLRFLLVQRLIALERIKEAIHHLETLTPVWKDQAEIAHMLGWCHDAVGQHAKAAVALQQAIQRNPHKLESYSLLAEILPKVPPQGDDPPPDPTDTFDAMVAANPKSARAYLERHRHHRRQDRADKASADILQSRMLAPDDPGVQQAAADWFQEQGDLVKAEECLQAGLKKNSKDVGLILTKARLDIRTQQLGQALALLTRAAQELPQAWDIQVLLTDLLIDDGKLEDARVRLNSLRRLGPRSALPDYLEARLALAEGKTAVALALLERLRPELGANPYWGSRVQALLGICFGELGDQEQRLNAFRRAVALEGTWTPARQGLAAALLATGRANEALLELATLEKQADAPAILPTLQARALLIHTLRKPEKERSWREFDQALERAVRQTPQALPTLVLQAEVLAAKNQGKEAAALLDQAQEKQPDSLDLYLARSELAQRQGQKEQADQILTQARKRLGDKTELLLAQVRWAAAQEPEVARVNLETWAATVDKLPPDLRLPLWTELAQIWTKRGDRPQARILWEKVAQAEPRDVRSRLALFQLALHENALDQAKKWTSDLKRLEGAQGNLGRFAGISLTLVEAHEKKKDRAKALDDVERQLRLLAKDEPDWPRVPALAAQLAEQRGQTDVALDHYRHAFDLGDRDPALVHRLTALLLQRRRFLDAEAVLTKVEESRSLSPELARLGAEVALGNQDLPRARAQAEAAVPLPARNHQDLLWLARMFRALRDDRKAEDCLRQATQLASHAPETWLALLHHLVRTEQRPEAAKVLEEAGRRLPEAWRDPTLARAQEILGQVDLAASLFQQALNARPDDFLLLAQAAEFHRRQEKPQQAELALRNLLASTAPAVLRQRALRDWAVAKAATGHEADRKKALGVLEASLAGKTPTLADERVRLFLQGLNPSQRRQSIDAFQRALPGHPASPEETFLLAQLLQANGDFLRVRELLAESLATQEDQPHVLSFLIRSLAQAEDVDEAKTYLARLERLEPGSARVRELRALVNKG